ncbi:HlyD family efflux transporter periplasmic adaptor subunit, partial [Acinetobacter baumannii]
APFVVENTAAQRLDLQVPERLAGRVRAGLPVSFGLDGRSVRGTVLSVGLSLAPQTRALPARASLPADPQLVPGTGVQATVTAPAPA